MEVAYLKLTAERESKQAKPRNPARVVRIKQGRITKHGGGADARTASVYPRRKQEDVFALRKPGRAAAESA